MALTLDVYSRIPPREDRDAAERIADLLLSALLREGRPTSQPVLVGVAVAATCHLL